VVALADAIKDMGALKSLNISNNNTGELVLQEMDNSLCLKGCAYGFHKKGCPNEGTERKSIPEGAIALADAIKNNGAILSVNLLKNGIGVEQARALVVILNEHSTLKSLCGNNGDETELDMSGKMNGAEDAIMLATEIIDNGALAKLDMSTNGIGAEQEEDLQRICMAGGIELTK
jgi:hypothetical protein